MQACDLVGYYTTKGNKRVLTFDLTDTITAKNCAKIKPVVMGDVASMGNAMTAIINLTHESLQEQDIEHREAVGTVDYWSNYAQTCDPLVIFSELETAKLKKTEKTAVWASVTRVMNSRGYEYDKEAKVFIQSNEEQSNVLK